MGYDIPLFDLEFGPEEEEAVLATLRSKWLSMGPRVQEVEERFAARLGVRHAVAVTNCTAALHLALKVVGVGPGDEVITPSLTFVATVNAIRYAGAEPVFADVTSLEDLALDPADVARSVTERTRALLPMHYGGFAADMPALLEIARDRDLRVVEDNAHGPGATHREACLGTLGDVGCFSFFANKNITCAEGGLLTTNDDEFAARLRLLRAHGMTTLSFERAKGHATSYDVVELGYNYRLDDVRGALLLAQLDRLADDAARRRELRAAYEEGLADVAGLVVPYVGHAHDSSNYIMPVILEEGGVARREAVRRALAERGIQTSVHYPAVHRFSIYADCARDLPLTEHVADHEITLPMYPSLTRDQVRFVCETLQRSL